MRATAAIIDKVLKADAVILPISSTAIDVVPAMIAQPIPMKMIGHAALN